MKSLFAVAALALSFACAGTSASSSSAPMASGQGAACSPTTAGSGTIVYSRPDATSAPIATLSSRTQLCADADAVGFGFRHVRLGNGQEGFVADNDLG
jgi:hypothetical protein